MFTFQTETKLRGLNVDHVLMCVLLESDAQCLSESLSLDSRSVKYSDVSISDDTKGKCSCSLMILVLNM